MNVQMGGECERERVCFTSAMLCCELNPSKSNSTKYLGILILFISVCRLCYKKIDQIPVSKSVILMSDKRRKNPTQSSNEIFNLRQV